MTEEQVDLLVKKYRDPDRPGLVVYLNLHHDIVEIGKRFMKDEINARVGQLNISDYLLPATVLL